MRRYLLQLALFFSFILGLSGCAKEDGSKILGHWRAERVKLMSLNIPIGPEFVITKDELVALETDLHIPIKSISQNGNEVVLNVPVGLGLSFYFDGPDRMYFDVPFAGKIYYQRKLSKQSSTEEATPAASAAAITMPSFVPVPPTVTSPILVSPSKLTAQSLGVLTNTVPIQEITTDTKQTQKLPLKSDGDLVHSGAIEAELRSNKAASNELIKVAIAKMAQGKLDEAEKDLLEARKRTPQQSLVYYNMAILRLKQGRSDDALKEFEFSFKTGFSHFQMMDQDSDLDGFRNSPAFLELTAKYH